MTTGTVNVVVNSLKECMKKCSETIKCQSIEYNVMTHMCTRYEKLCHVEEVVPAADANLMYLTRVGKYY